MKIGIIPLLWLSEKKGFFCASSRADALAVCKPFLPLLSCFHHLKCVLLEAQSDFLRSSVLSNDLVTISCYPLCHWEERAPQSSPITPRWTLDFYPVLLCKSSCFPFGTKTRALQTNVINFLQFIPLTFHPTVSACYLPS